MNKLLGIALTLALLLPGMALAAMSDGAFLELAGKAYATAVAKALREGANPNARDKYGTTALMRATKVGNVGSVAALLQAGADVNAQDEWGKTVLMGALMDNTGWQDNADVVGLLLASGANVNAATKDGETALMHAARYGNAKSIRALLAAGADVKAADKDGSTALMHAAENRDAEPSKSCSKPEQGLTLRTRMVKRP